MPEAADLMIEPRGTHKMNGQWLGSYTESMPRVAIVINIDERRTHYQGVAYLNQHDKNLPSTAAFFRTKDKSAHFDFRTSGILPVNPFTNLPDAGDRIKSHYAQDMTISSSMRM